jgi:hypothetical protein
MELSIIALFCCLDDFAREFEKWERNRLIATGRQRHRVGKLGPGAMLFIMVLFHQSPFRDFKRVRFHGVEQKYRWCFGDLPACERFVALKPRLFIPLYILLSSPEGRKTGIYIMGSTRLAVCHNACISGTGYLQV